MLAPIPITSLTDSRIHVFRNVRDADLRGRDGLFMAESELVLRRLLQSPNRLYALLLSPQKLERLESALTVLPPSVSVFVADLPLISAIAGFHVHRGVLAAGLRLSSDQLSLNTILQPWHTKPTAPSTLLLAEGITNVDNMGALFRNAAAFGVNAIVLDPTCCDPLYRKAIRVSMGHTLSVPYAVSTDWPADLQRLKRDWSMTLIAAEVGQRSIPLWSMPRSPRTAILLGSEGHGLSPASLAAADAVCAIPMACPGISLNVAVASAVFLHELRSPRRT